MSQSWASTPGRRRNMQANRSKDTAPELAVRRLLHAQGLRYRVNTRPLKQVRRTADIVFGPTKTVVFIDGCFWHACPEHYSEPRANTAYWRPKIARNVERDEQINQMLADAGWHVLRFWSHEASVDVAREISKVVGERRGSDISS